jgi:hypothetical protein
MLNMKARPQQSLLVQRHGVGPVTEHRSDWSGAQNKSGDCMQVRQDDQRKARESLVACHIVTCAFAS